MTRQGLGRSNRELGRTGYAMMHCSDQVFPFIRPIAFVGFVVVSEEESRSQGRLTGTCRNEQDHFSIRCDCAPPSSGRATASAELVLALTTRDSCASGCCGPCDLGKTELRHGPVPRERRTRVWRLDQDRSLPGHPPSNVYSSLVIRVGCHPWPLVDGKPVHWSCVGFGGCNPNSDRGALDPSPVSRVRRICACRKARHPVSAVEAVFCRPNVAGLSCVARAKRGRRQSARRSWPATLGRQKTASTAETG